MSTGTSETLLESEPVELAGESAAEIAARSPLQLFWRRLRNDKVALTALGIVVLMVLIAIFAPLIVKVFHLPNPNTQNDDLLDDFGSPTGPSSAHLFGVDERGRDVFTRVLYG
ncbi:MAG: ABC transporter permease, partial [Baekduia sp.]